MFSRVIAKQAAKSSLKGNWKISVLGMLLYFLITQVLIVPLAIISDYDFTLNILYLTVSFLVSAFSYGGISYFFYTIYRGKQAYLKDFLWSFNYPLKMIGLFFFISLFTFLWSLLFIIPGMIKAYSYHMAIYILIDHPELSPLEAITQSRILMHGSKADLFVTDLSFIGWVILATLSFGIGFLWLTPYIQVTHVAIYHQLKGTIQTSTSSKHLNEPIFTDEMP